MGFENLVELFLQDEDEFRRLLGGSKVTFTIARISPKKRRDRNGEIRKLYDTGESMKKLSRQFDISISTIKRILREK